VSSLPRASTSIPGTTWTTTLQVLFARHARTRQRTDAVKVDEEVDMGSFTYDSTRSCSFFWARASSTPCSSKWRIRRRMVFTTTWSCSFSWMTLSLTATMAFARAARLRARVRPVI
jgi:hypothetical protein